MTASSAIQSPLQRNSAAFALYIAGDPRNFACVALKPDSEKVSEWSYPLALRLLSPVG